MHHTEPAGGRRGVEIQKAVSKVCGVKFKKSAALKFVSKVCGVELQQVC